MPHLICYAVPPCDLIVTLLLRLGFEGAHLGRGEYVFGPNIVCGLIAFCRRRCFFGQSCQPASGFNVSLREWTWARHALVPRTNTLWWGRCPSRERGSPRLSPSAPADARRLRQYSPR